MAVIYCFDLQIHEYTRLPHSHPLLALNNPLESSRMKTISYQKLALPYQELLYHCKRYQ